MFDIAWSELMLIAVVALVVIGPKDLPKAIFTLGKWVRKARVVAREFQTHIDDMMRETELDELRREALKTRDMNIKKMMEDTIDPKGEVSKAFEVDLNGHPGSPPEGDADTTAATTSASAPAPATALAAAEGTPAAIPAPTTTVSTPAPAPVATTPTDKQA